MHSQSTLANLFLLVCAAAVFISVPVAVSARSSPQRSHADHLSRPLLHPRALDLTPEEVARLNTLTPLQRVAELFPGTVSEFQLQNDATGDLFKEREREDRNTGTGIDSDRDSDSDDNPIDEIF